MSVATTSGVTRARLLLAVLTVLASGGLLSLADTDIAADSTTFLSTSVHVTGVWMDEYVEWFSAQHHRGHTAS